MLKNLEVIGTTNFDYNKIGIDNLLPFIENTLDEIGSKKRKYIIFCGSVFSKLLRSFIQKEDKQKFKLKKVDGTETLHFFDLTKIEIATNQNKFSAIIAPQFAKQGCPITNYGIEIAKRYHEK